VGHSGIGAKDNGYNVGGAIMFEWLKYAYPRGMATIEQCKSAVVRGKITIEQYREITGEEYIA
jgi:hypothetical protein